MKNYLSSTLTFSVSCLLFFALTACEKDETAKLSNFHDGLDTASAQQAIVGEWEWVHTNTALRGMVPKLETPASEKYEMTWQFSSAGNLDVLKDNLLHQSGTYKISAYLGELRLNYSQNSQTALFTVSQDTLRIDHTYNDAGGIITFIRKSDETE